MKKQKLKALFKLGMLLFGISFFTLACQKEDDINLNQVVENKILVEHISSKNLDSKTARKIYEKSRLLQQPREYTDGQEKFEYNTDLGIYIDLDNGRLVNNNGTLFYTYPMYRENEDKLENIIFKP